jgi:polyhydroxybutyrate depolymerase
VESAPVSATLKRRVPVIGTVLAQISLPVVLVVIDAASFHVRNRSNGGFVSQGQKREYLLYVPPSYDPTRPSPLVISLHGAGLWGAAQKEISRWNEVADREGLIVVYPSGTSGDGPRVWHMEPGAGPNRDVAFIAALIDTIEAAYNIDAGRIYADGLSNGGGMAFVLSCTLSDRIAAVGLVASAQLLPWNWCTDDRPVPMIAFHGTADRFTPYAGGRSWVAPDYRFPSIPAWTATWARRNRCGPTPADSMVAPDVTRIEYLNCAEDATVVLYRVEGGGHTWPGGGPLPEWFAGRTSRNIDATGLMWAFFREHRLMGRSHGSVTTGGSLTAAAARVAATGSKGP